VFILLGVELRLAVGLSFANVVLSIALLAEPVLFGKVIESIHSISRESGVLLKIFPLLLSWTFFGLLGVVSSIMIGLLADRMAHRHRHVIAKDFYKRALRCTPLTFQGGDSGKLYKIMNDGEMSCFWNWLTILRQDLSALIMLVILLPFGMTINVEMGLILLILCVVFTLTTFFVVNKAQTLQKAVNDFYNRRTTICSDVLANLPLIQAFDGIHRELEKIDENAQIILKNQIPVLNYWVVVVMFNQCATSLTVLIVIIEGARLYGQGVITVGDIVTFISFANMIIAKLRLVVDAVNRMSMDYPKLQA